MQTLRHYGSRLEDRLASMDPEVDSASALSSMQESAKDLALAARKRLHEQTDSHRRFVQAQRKDDRATFIYSLVLARAGTTKIAQASSQRAGASADGL